MSNLSAYFLVGPTVVGKSRVAHAIAERDGFDIVSADSMLVYKGMDIGTAKPTREDQAKVRYWGIDLVDPGQRFSAGAYRKAAKEALAEISRLGRKAIVVGGTGLYIKSLTHGFSSRPQADLKLRSDLQNILKEKGSEELRRMLAEKNRGLYEAIEDKQNPRRLIRALELAYADVESGPGKWKQQGPGPAMAGLFLPKDQLQSRIMERVREMWKRGLVEEVEGLLSRGFDALSAARQAIGYAEAVDYIKGLCSREEAIERTALRTRHLAKRQLTWFRHQANVKWIDIDNSSDISSITRAVEAFWRDHGPTPIAD